MLSRFGCLTRLREHENSQLYSKLRVYDGENLKDTDPKARSVQEYREVAGVDEGMNGISTRFAFKVLSETFNFDTDEIAADPVHLMYVLERSIKREQFPDEVEATYLDFIKSELAPRYAEFIGHEIQKAYLESYTEYGQNLFDRYIAYADAWIEEQDYKDPDTGQIFNREILDAELSKIEKPAGHRQSQGLPQRGRQVRLARAGQQRGQEPVLDQLREAARGDREAHVQPGRGPAAGDQLRHQEGQLDRQAAPGVPDAHGRARLHRPPGAAAGRMVHAGQQGRIVPLRKRL